MLGHISLICSLHIFIHLHPMIRSHPSSSSAVSALVLASPTLSGRSYTCMCLFSWPCCFLESYLKNTMEPNEFLTIWGPILNPNCPNPPPKPHDGWLWWHICPYPHDSISIPTLVHGSHVMSISPVSRHCAWSGWTVEPPLFLDVLDEIPICSSQPGHHSGANMPIPPGAAPTCNASAASDPNHWLPGWGDYTKKQAILKRTKRSGNERGSTVRHLFYICSNL